MVDIASFRFGNVGNAFDEGYTRVAGLQQDRALMRAGNALASGNTAGATNALYGAGMLTEGRQVQRQQMDDAAAARKLTEDQEAEVLKTTADMAKNLGNVREPQAVVANFDRFYAPRLAQLGESAEEIAQVRQALAADPRNTLAALGAAVEQRIKTFNTSGGVIAVDEAALEEDFTDANATRVLYEPPPDPLEEELMRARIAATQAQVGQRQASAEASSARAAKTRAAPAGGRRGSGRSVREMSTAELLAIAQGGR